MALTRMELLLGRRKRTIYRLRCWRSKVGSLRELGTRSGSTISGRRSCSENARTRYGLSLPLSPSPFLPLLPANPLDFAASQNFATMIKTLSTQGSRLIVGDVNESIFYVTYKSPENRLIVFADDVQPRWITASTMVDYETVAAGDKFGNFFVNRLPKDVSTEVDSDPTGAGILHEKPYLMGAAHKTGMVAHYHVGDIITSLTKVAMVAGGREVLLWTGLMGTVGVLVPFVSNEDVDFFSTLEMHLRTEAPSLVGTSFSFGPCSLLPPLSSY